MSTCYFGKDTTQSNVATVTCGRLRILFKGGLMPGGSTDQC